MDNGVGFKLNNIEEKEIKPLGGGLILLLVLIGFGVSVWAIIAGSISLSKENYEIGAVLLTGGIILVVVLSIMLNGFHILNPNEALV